MYLIVLSLTQNSFTSECTNTTCTKLRERPHQCSLRKFYTKHIFLVRTHSRNHVNTQPVKRCKRCDIYTVSNLECCKCARMKLHCADGLVALRSCAPYREHWSVYYIIR